MAEKALLCCRFVRKCIPSPFIRASCRSARCSFSHVFTSQHTQYSSVAEEDDTDEVNRLRNVSRLPEYLRRRMAHVQKPGRPSIEHRFPHLLSPNHDRWAYGKYGRKSGVNPSQTWPSKEELQEILDDETEFEMTLQEMWAKIEADKAAETKMRLDKEERVVKQMKKMPVMIEELQGKLKKAEDAEKAQEDKRRSLMNEARDYFGFDIDPRDPRFIHMQELKAEEEKLAKRKKKKEDKQARLMAMLSGAGKDSKAGKAKNKAEEIAAESTETDSKK